MNRRARLTVLLPICFAAACASTGKPKVEAPPPAVAAPPPSKTPLEEYMEREATDLAPQSLASADGVVKVQVLARGDAKIEKGDNLYEVTIPVGGASALDCLIFTERPDPAGKLQGLFGSVFAKFKRWEIAGVDAGQTGGNPFLHSEVAYAYDENKQEKVGYLKVSVLPLRQSGVLCMHDEPGYRDTFSKVVAGLVASLEVKVAKAVPPALYNEIQTITIGKQRVGFQQTQVLNAEKGKKSTLVFTGMLVPRSPTEFLATDEATFESGSAEGLLERGVYINAEQNEVKYELALEAQKKALHYKVTGKFQGQPVEAMLVAKEPLRDGRGQAALVAKSLLAAGATVSTLSFTDYAPGMDPKSLTSVTIHKPDPGKGDGSRYAIEAGPARITGQFDEHGHMKQSLLQMGSIDLLMERIFVEGSPDGAADPKPHAAADPKPAPHK